MDSLTSPDETEDLPATLSPSGMLFEPEPDVASVGRPRKRGRIALYLALFWLGLLVLFAVLANVLPIHSPDTFVTNLPPKTPPRFSWTEPLGTDSLDRSVLSWLIFGARESLIIAVGSVVLASILGLIVGTIAGYFRGLVSSAIDVLLYAVLAVPAIVLLVAVASIGQRNTLSIIIVLGVIGAPFLARVVRTNTLSLANREYVQAAKALGSGSFRVIGREILPEVFFRVLPLQVLFAAYVVVAEASLSYLGFGLPPPSPSWGDMINSGSPFLASDPYLVFIPALCIVFTVASFTTIGDRLRRHFYAGESALG